MKNKLRFLYIVLSILLIATLVTLLVRDGFNLSSVEEWLSSETVRNRLYSIIYHFAIIGVISLVSKFVQSFINKTKKNPKYKKNLAVIELLSSFVKYTAGILIVLVLGSMIGVDVTALVAGAGILGLVIGLGAQSLIADILAGIFIVIEKNYNVGDIVIIDNFKGKVIEIGIRSTKIMDVGGDIKSINNSSIITCINTSFSLSIAKCVVAIEYEESVEKVEKIIKDNLQNFKNSIPSIKEGPTFLGIQALAASGVELVIIAHCLEEDKMQVIRDLNREIKLLFDKENINIPFNQIVVNYKDK